jgi:serine/threonine-protein kinase
LGEVVEDAKGGTRYRVTGFIGKGGMGEVYLGQAEGSGLVVAIKTLPLALVHDKKIALRTQFESKALQELRHRNVVPVYASGVRQDGVIFMVMRYLPGMTLLDLRRKHGRIPIAWSLHLVRDACRGLSAIHEVAVHRDVKPANLHFGVDAILRVLDLGMAKWKASGMRLTSAGTQLGTLAYMAPEALDESAPVDACADIWSTADRHPFAFAGQLPDNAFVLGSHIIGEMHVPLRDVAPLCPGYLARIVDKTLAKDPRDRYGSAVELGQALSDAMLLFANEHGAAQPLEELAAGTFPDAPRPAPATEIAAKTDLSHLYATTPLGPDAGRAQAAALPYLRTEEIPPAIVAAAAQAARGSEPEPPRVSDVFPRRERPPKTLLDTAEPAPATVRDHRFSPALPLRPQPTVRRTMIVGIAAVALLVVIAAGAAIAALAGWAP